VEGKFEWELYVLNMYFAFVLKGTSDAFQEEETGKYGRHLL
jgi:hypothetical protein